MAKVVYNVRCVHCDAMYEEDSFLPASHYDAFESYLCNSCGKHGFFGVAEIKHVSLVDNPNKKWYKPWTWLKIKKIEWEDVPNGDED